MIEGVKCSCIGLDPDRWRVNPNLDFEICVSETTGEMLTSRRVAKVNSMRFILSPQRGGGFTCSLAGSLHRYHNANDTNYNAFTFANLSQTVDDLHDRFGVDPSTAIIHSLE